MSLKDNLITFGESIYEGTEYSHTSLWLFIFYVTDDLCSECSDNLLSVMDSLNTNKFLKNVSNNLKVVIDYTANENSIISPLANEWSKPLFVFCKKDGIIDIIRGNPSKETINSRIKEYIY